MIHGDVVAAAPADEPLEQYVTFWQRPHLFKPEAVGISTSDLLQTTHTRGSTAAFAESAIVMFPLGKVIATLAQAEKVTRCC